MDGIKHVKDADAKVNMMKVANICEAYQSLQHKWKVVRDCVAGSDAVKAAGTEYLPAASYKTTVEGVKRYNAFKERAVFVPFVYSALNIMHGLVCRRTPTIKAPDDFLNSGLLGNVDRKGSSIYQFSSDALYDVMQTGFGGILLDMPQAPDGITVAEAEKLGIRPYLRYYPAEDIHIWTFKDNSGSERLAFIDLHEKIDVSDDEFVQETEDRYRVLSFDSDGNYIQRLYTPVKDGKGSVVDYEEKVIPIKVNGKSIQYLPFVLLPYNHEPETPPLYNISTLNIAHYQSTADYKNGVHMTTIPTGYITGHKSDNYGDNPNEKKDDDITLGSDILLTEEDPDAKFGVLTFAGEGLVHAETDIDKIESQIAGIFIKDIAPDKKTSETAESAYVHRAGENARLATLVRNFSNGVTQILQWYVEWNNYKGMIEFEMNYDYETMSLDPNIINSIANISGQGKFPLYCVFWILKQQELIEPDMNYDEFIFLIDEESLGELSAAEIYDAFKKKRSERVRIEADAK